MAAGDELAESASLMVADMFIARDQGNSQMLESGSGASGDAFDSAYVHISNVISVQLRAGRLQDARDTFDRYGGHGKRFFQRGPIRTRARARAHMHARMNAHSHAPTHTHIHTLTYSHTHGRLSWMICKHSHTHIRTVACLG